MPTLSSPGIGSGLDVGSIVQQLVTLEQRPIIRNQERQVELQAAISAFGKLSSTFSEFQTAMRDLSTSDEFRIFDTTSSDDEVATASASSEAERGVFNFEVQRLAENHRMVAGTSLPDSTATTVGTAGDTMSITVGTNAFTVETGGKTLDEIRNAINDANDNTGVTASIITDDTGSYLTLTAAETGSDAALSVAYSAADPFSMTTLNADRDGSGGFTAADLDAVAVLENQFTLTRSTNTFSDAASGVTFTAKSAGTATITIGRDDQAVKKNIEKFVKAFNNVVSLMDEMGKGILSQDNSTLRSIESQMRGVINESAGNGGAFSRLFEIGISTTRTGTLEIDDTTLTTSIQDNFNDVAALFSSEGTGYAIRFDALADSFLQTGGVFDARQESLGSEIGTLKDRKVLLEQRVTIKEARLQAQFGALDGLLASLNAQSDYLLQQLDGLANLNRQVSGN